MFPAGGPLPRTATGPGKVQMLIDGWILTPGACGRVHGAVQDLDWPADRHSHRPGLGTDQER
jgi:hypothetical protein